jgi:hypothetical protein
MNVMIREFALVNLIIICLVFFCAFGVLAFVKRQFES